MRILFIGNSHTGAIKRGFDNLYHKISKDIDIKISGAGNPYFSKWKVVDSVIYPDHDLRGLDNSPYSVADYDLIAVCAGYGASDPRLLYKNKIQLLSRAILEKVVISHEDRANEHSKHNKIVQYFLSNACSKNILIVGSPYPSSKLYHDYIEEGVPPYRKKSRLKKLHSTLLDLHNSLQSLKNDKDHAIQIHKNNYSTILNIFKNLERKMPRIKYYFPPSSVLDETGLFTKKELMNRDLVHGNQEYGEIVLSNILKNLPAYTQA